MSPSGNGAKMHIVFESNCLGFENGIREWLDNKGLRNAEIQGSGKSVLVVVETEGCEAIRKSLRAGEVPPDLYRAFLPPEGQGLLEDVIPGGSFELDNAETRKAYGRHAALSAFPSQLAKLRHGGSR